MYLMGKDLINPTRLGKISIFLLYVAIAASLLDIKFFDMLLFYVVIPINIISAVDYIRNAYQKM